MSFLKFISLQQYLLLVLLFTACNGNRLPPPETSTLHHFEEASSTCEAYFNPDSGFIRNEDRIVKCFRVPFALATPRDRQELINMISGDLNSQLQRMSSDIRNTLDQLRNKNPGVQISPTPDNSLIKNRLEDIKQELSGNLLNSGVRVCSAAPYQDIDLYDEIKFWTFNIRDSLKKSQYLDRMYKTPNLFSIGAGINIGAGAGVTVGLSLGYSLSIYPYISLGIDSEGNIKHAACRVEYSRGADLSTSIGFGAGFDASAMTTVALGLGPIRGTNYLGNQNFGAAVSGGTIGRLEGQILLNQGRSWAQGRANTRTISQKIKNLFPSDPPLVLIQGSVGVGTTASLSAGLVLSNQIDIGDLLSRLEDRLKNSGGS
nr:hypothetical protein [Oligoflexales bacterium]